MLLLLCATTTTISRAGARAAARAGGCSGGCGGSPHRSLLLLQQQQQCRGYRFERLDELPGSEQLPSVSVLLTCSRRGTRSSLRLARLTTSPCRRPHSHSHDTQQQIALVGRPNVGKSALFNRLVHRRDALVRREHVGGDRALVHSAPSQSCRCQHRCTTRRAAT
jgi:hypothetical protein